MEVVKGRSMGDFEGEQTVNRDRMDECPVCGQLKYARAKTCVQCSPRRKVRRSRQATDNHRRFEAAVKAGWDEGELIASRPNLPTWEEIAEKCPEAVMRWRPEVVIERWWHGA